MKIRLTPIILLFGLMIVFGAASAFAQTGTAPEAKNELTEHGILPILYR